MEQSSAMSERLSLCRRQAGETLEQVARLIGVNKSTVLRWEQGATTHINRPTLERLAAHFGVDPNWLLGGDVPRVQPGRTPEEVEDWLHCRIVPPHTLVRLPILRTVLPGENQPVIGYESVEIGVLQRGEEYFWLKAEGDSMSPTINDGDLVLILRQDRVDNNSYAVVLVNDEECLLKRYVASAGWVELHSVNPYYPTRRFEGDRAQSIRVIGRVVESRRKFGY